MSVEIEGFLTEKKLVEALKSIIPKEDWIGTQIRVGCTLKRWDMSFKIQDQIYNVEFDGYRHYRDIAQIRTDKFKDDIAKDLNQKVIRIPYWVQLTTKTLKHYFGIDYPIQQNFPHGFISEEAMLPIDYSEAGIERFSFELSSLPKEVQIEIIDNLKSKMILTKLEVLPKSLLQILD